MPFTRHAIHGDASAWHDAPLVGLSGRIEHNLGSQSIADEKGRLGSTPLSFSSNQPPDPETGVVAPGGAFSVDLPATDDPSVVAQVEGTLQYRVLLSFTDPGGGGKRNWDSGWFSLTADVNAFTVEGSVTPEAAASGAAFLAEMEAIRDAAIAPTETQVRTVVTTDLDDPESEIAGRLSETIAGTAETGVARILYVSPNGDDTNSGQTMSLSKATIASALTAMGTDIGTIVLDNGEHDAGTTLAWPATAKCGMVGQGDGKTTIVASSQTGPILDLSAVGYNLNRSEFGGFTLQGDGTAGSAKKGLRLSSTVSMVGSYIHDIAVNSTGGAPFDLGMAELCDFDRLSADEPVSATANDIPYLMAAGAFNGNTINRLCLSATVTGSGTVGASGAVVIKDNGATTPHDNKINDPQIQGLRLPTDATIFALAGNGTVVSDIQQFDQGKVAGATGTSVVRFTAPAVLDLGGNLVRGVIPGKGTDASSIDSGVDARQSRNAVVGIKGYRGTNVVIAAGVVGTHVHLGGAVSAAIDPAVVDNSGLTNNVVVDAYMRATRWGPQEFTQGAARYAQDQPGGAWAGGVRFYDPATPANGLLGLGTAGVRSHAVGAVRTETADTFIFRNIALANMFAIGGAAGARGCTLFDSGGALPAASSTYRGKLLWVQSDAGADRLVICRKDAGGAYAWVDLF